MNRMAGICLPLSDPRFTPKQGQYLAFIYAYTQVLGRPPAEADLQRHFRVSPPSVHQMVLTLERAGLIRRTVGGARSIEVLVDPEALPVLRPAQEQPVKSSVQRQGNRVKESGSDEACEEIIVPAGGFALEALRVLAGHFTDEIVCHVL